MLMMENTLPGRYVASVPSAQFNPMSLLFTEMSETLLYVALSNVR